MKNDGSYDKISLILIFGHFRSKYAFLGWKGGPKMAKNSKNIFLFFSRPSASFSCIITIYIDQISKNRFLGRFGTVRPKSRKTGFFGKIPAGSTFFEYCPPTSGQKSGKSLEPFSKIFWFTTIFGPFWAIFGRFGTVKARFLKNENFFGKTVTHDSCHNSKEPWCKKWT